jgi:hypothetical protein
MCADMQLLRSEGEKIQKSKGKSQKYKLKVKNLFSKYWFGYFWL